MQEDPPGRPTPIADPEAAAEVIRLVEEARALWERRKLADSEGPLRRALELAEGKLGPDHQHVSVVLEHLGRLANARGRDDEAVAAFRRSLAIREAGFGPDHSKTFRAVEDLASALFQVRAHEEADALSLRAIAGQEAAGRDDAGLAELVDTVAWRRYFVGRYAEAEPMFLRALEMHERLLGPDDTATAGTAGRLAVMYDHRGFDADPIPYYRRSLSGFEASVDADHPEAFEARFRLADCLRRRGLDHEAAPLFEQLVASLADDVKAIDLDSVHWMLGDLCQYLCDLGREGEAESIKERARSHDSFLLACRAGVDWAELCFGPDSPELEEALGRLAVASAHAGLADEAEGAARRVLALRTARLGPDDPATTEAAACLVGIRPYAEQRAVEPPARPRLDRLSEDQGNLFSPFSRPWADERRSDLIRLYLASFDEPDGGDPTGAVEAITALTFLADLDEQWGLIRELIGRAPDDAQILQALAAGPLEGLLGRFDGEAIDRVEAEAARDPRFRRVLSGVWKHGMSDPVWARIQAMQETEPNPLPEYRPIAAGGSSPHGPHQRGVGDHSEDRFTPGD